MNEIMRICRLFLHEINNFVDFTFKFQLNFFLFQINLYICIYILVEYIWKYAAV